MGAFTKGYNIFMQKLGQKPIYSDYQKWRDTFLYQKLQLAIVIWSFFHAAIEINSLVPEFLGKYYKRGLVSALIFFVNSSRDLLIQELIFIGCLILLHLPKTQKYLKAIFIIFACSIPFYHYFKVIITTIPYLIGLKTPVSESVDIVASLGESLDTIHCLALNQIRLGLDTKYYHLLFPIIGVLVPVCLRLHVTSQISVFLFGIFAYFFNNPTYNFWKLSQEQQIACSTDAIYSLIFTLLPCVVVDYGIYLYELTLKTEFKYWWQLRLFVNAVAHDLRNPVLGTILVLENLLKQAPDKLEVDKTIVENLVIGNKRQLDLIDSLLEAHASETQGIKVYPQSIKLSPLVQSIIRDLLSILNQERTIVISLIKSELPEVYVDVLQLSRVYHNLIINAIKVNQPGLQITIDAWVVEDKLHCIVADNGIGMSQQQATKLFELYARGQNLSQSLGLGLGLYICQQIIRAHGGEIGVNSSPGEGATFWFTLPLSK
jgi:signal transduction histidine kinase